MGKRGCFKASDFLILLDEHLATFRALEERLDKHGSWLYKLENLNIPYHVSKAVDEIVTDAVDLVMQAALRARFSDLPIPPPPPPQVGAFGAHGTSGASGSCQLPPPPPPLSTGTSGSAQQQGSKALNDSIHDEQVYLSDDEDSGNGHLPTAYSRKGWWKPLPAEERPATPEPAWTIPSSNVSDVDNNWASALALTYVTPAENSLLVKTRYMTNFLNWYCRQVNKTKLIQADLEGQTYEVVKAFYPDVIHLQFQMEECHKLLTDQVDWTNPKGDQVKYLSLGSKGSSHALSISKMKATSYPDFGLELLVPEQMWIEDVCTYDISAKYGFDYLSEIILRRADLQEHTIIVKDFENMHPSDFNDINLLLLQGHLDHLPGSDKKMLSTSIKLWTRNLVIRQRVKDFQLGIKSYQTELNLTKPGWDDAGYEFKHDYTIIESPRAIVTGLHGQGIQDQAAQSRYGYVLLDSKGCDKEQRVHSGY
nr:hypothetical protein [Tanacetum cinerariifolium]GEX64054.1 hypothetical protein [Tanacetum cinerariifolium]